MSGDSSGLVTVLHAAGPAPDRAEDLNLYAWLIGDWEAEITAYSADGQPHAGHGEIHFGWILEGRAIQDVWMIPRRGDHNFGALPIPVVGNWYGTTIRAYDPTIGAWRIYWIDPATNSFRYQIGRRQGEDIVQEGMTEAGALSRWSFSEITHDAFRWRGEASTDGKAWRLVVEVCAHRVTA